MTLVVQCVQRGGKLVPLDARKIQRWKARHTEGQVCDLILDDYGSSALTPLAKKFHAIRDEYAALLGYDNDHAKIELKYLFGTWTELDAIPTGRTGRVVEYHGHRLWLLSIRDYTAEELQRLVAGSDLALQEVDV